MAKVSPNFAAMQEKAEKPSCYGKYGKPEKGKKCGFCWFHPDCKEAKPKRKAKVKKEDVIIEPVAELPLGAKMDDVDIEVDE